MIRSNIFVGKTGEDLACEYLVNKGYKIIDRNYRTKWDEIDIISKAKDGTLVFVEVKTLNAVLGGLVPEDNLTGDKHRKISRACQLFANQRADLIKEDKGWRIDLVAISIDENDRSEIKQYENI
ncbi:MAG: YraN family protein [Parcubacteria group bacterium]|nr:YraN family protein [Parcubacteria group bacterium]